MALDKTTASGVLKEFYLPTVHDQLVNKNEYLAQLEKNDQDVEGTEAVLSLHVGRNQGIGARKELEDLPAPGNQAYVKQRVNLKYNYGQLQISGPVMRAMKSDNGSWLRALESETKGVVNDLKFDVERQLLGTSDGVIAATGVTSASTTVVTTATRTQLRHLKANMLIDIGTVASPTAVASARTIVSVDTSAGTIVISGAAVTTATTDRIFRAGNGGATTNQRELTGLQNIVDSTGSLFGVDPATYPEWSSYEKDAAGAALSDALVEELIDEVSIVSPLGVPDWAITDHRQARAYSATLTGQRRFTNDGKLRGGFTGIEIGTASGSLVLSTLRDAPVQTLFAVNRSDLTEYRASDWEFMDEDGSVLQRIVTGNGKDGYGATLFKYAEQAVSYRNAHGKITNLAA
jgi:hypothetical protein